MLKGSFLLDGDLTPRRTAALAAVSVVVGIPLGVQAGQIVVDQASTQPTPEERVPTAPEPREPSDGALAADRTPTFVWSPSRDESPVSYTLQYTPDPTFDADVRKVTVFGMRETTYTVADEHRLQPGTTYYWRVMSVDAWSNPSGWSDDSRFTTGP